MPTFLLTNDDGIQSPTLGLLAESLQCLGRVRVVVPETERSWIGKAISRFGTIKVRRVSQGRHVVYAVSGTPADCVNLGTFELFPDRPDAVIAGINLGLNFGSAFLLSSGTIGAAIEARIAGIPSLAFSMAIPRDAYGLSGGARELLLGTRPADAALVAQDITRTILANGFPPDVDLFSVNFPADVNPASARRVTTVARTRYGSLFTAAGDDTYQHQLRTYEVAEGGEDTDVPTVSRNEISITPLRLDFNTRLPESLVRALQR